RRAARDVARGAEGTQRTGGAVLVGARGAGDGDVGARRAVLPRGARFLIGCSAELPRRARCARLVVQRVARADDVLPGRTGRLGHAGRRRVGVVVPAVAVASARRGLTAGTILARHAVLALS